MGKTRCLINLDEESTNCCHKKTAICSFGLFVMDRSEFCVCHNGCVDGSNQKLCFGAITGFSTCAKLLAHKSRLAIRNVFDPQITL